MGWTHSLLFFAVIVCVSLGSGQDEQVEVMIPMRDGVLLHTLINFPDKAKYGRTNLTFVIDRSPYGQDSIELISDIYVPAGLVGVRQDMRGTQKSQGVFTMWHSDADDTYDTIQWLVAQNWSSGTAFQCGASADGLAAFTTPEDQPPQLKAQFIVWASSDAYTVIYPGGGYLMNLVYKWLEGTIPSNSTALIEEVEANEDPAGSWWDAVDLTGKYWKVNYPTVMWAGWYDIFLQGNLEGYNGFQYQSDPSVQGKMKLVIDPLGHCQDAYIYFPDDLIEGRSLLPVILSYNLFLNIGADPDNVSAVTFYVMGPDAHQYPYAKGNFWTSVPAFPTATNTIFYINPNQQLLPTAPSGDNSLSWVYDPSNPVPSIGGNNLFIPCGPLDQRPVEQGNRSDVLTFTTPALTTVTPVMGNMIVTLYVTSDQVDTDFTVKVTDVYTDGTSRLIQDGMVRLRWRNGSPAMNITPGVIYEINCTLWATSYVYNTGHSIRVSISSSNWPRFSANPNNGWALNTTGYGGPNHTATNSIFFSPKYPARITIPTVNLNQLPPIRLYELKQQAIDIMGEEAVEKILSRDPVIDSYYSPVYSKIRELNTPEWMKGVKL